MPSLTYDRDFAAFLTARDAGGIVEIDEEMFYYFLEVLPPVVAGPVRRNGEAITWKGMSGTWTRKDGSRQWFSFAFAEGKELLTVFWAKSRGGPYFAQRTGIENPCW